MSFKCLWDIRQTMESYIMWVGSPKGKFRVCVVETMEVDKMAQKEKYLHLRDEVRKERKRGHRRSWEWTGFLVLILLMCPEYYSASPYRLSISPLSDKKSSACKHSHWLLQLKRGQTTPLQRPWLGVSPSHFHTRFPPPSWQKFPSFLSFMRQDRSFQGKEKQFLMGVIF